MHYIEKFLEFGGIKKEIILLVLSGVALIISIFDIFYLPFDASWIAIILCGIPIILEALVGLITSFDIKADVLVSIALIASIATNENFAAGEVAFIMQLGALLEDLTVAKARSGIEKLIHMTPQTARLIENDSETIIPAEKVAVGDIIRVLPGETIPVDGTIISGQTSINQAVMTGESLPVDKGPGDSVSSGTVNQFGAFTMVADRVGEDSSMQRMVRLVQSADAGKAKIVSLADKWATWIVVIALTAAAITWLVTHEIIRAVTILVVFCPCSLVLATPTAIMAAIGNATKHGFLISEGDALERLSQVSKITFDKTGTLTNGSPQVIAVESIRSDIDRQTLYSLAASAELHSEPPLGKAVVNSFQAKYGFLPPEPIYFKMIPGRGVSATVSTHRIISGNAQLLYENGIETPPGAEAHLSNGNTIIYIAIDGLPSGYLALADTVRSGSTEIVRSIRKIGIEPVLLTGDNENAAKAIAEELGISDVRANCLPEDKLQIIDSFQKKGQKVCMIGDGINDAPALKKADVGIAMGGIGSDITVDAADIALVDDDIKEIPHLLSLSKKMMQTIKCNITFSMVLNFLAISLAIPGKLNPVIGALVHNAGSVLVIANSAFLLRWKKKYLNKKE